MQLEYLESVARRRPVCQQDGHIRDVFSKYLDIWDQAKSPLTVARDNIKAVSEPNLNVPTFPYKVWNLQTNTATLCITRCQEFGFSAAGLEYGEECCEYRSSH